MLRVRGRKVRNSANVIRDREGGRMMSTFCVCFISFVSFQDRVRDGWLA